MRKFLLIILILSAFTLKVSATEFSASEIPKEAQTYLTDDPAGFWDDLQRVVLNAIREFKPEAAEVVKTCMKIATVTLLGAMLSHFSVESKFVAQLVTTVSISLLLLSAGHSLLEQGEETVQDISEYGKLLLPILTASLAAQGGVSSSAVLYAGTLLFSNILNTLISKLLIPLLYLFLCICIANSVLADDMLKRVKAFIKWGITWVLKITLYIFTGYMSISGVISGTVDASALKATKLAISGTVPVVGSILSDASETILLSAGVVKNSIGAYGLVALISLLIGPFLEIGIYYILMKGTSAVCAIFAGKDLTNLLDDYASVMGYILAMTGISCVLLLVGIVCMMKGVG